MFHMKHLNREIAAARAALSHRRPSAARTKKHESPLDFSRGLSINPGDDLLSPAKDYHRPRMLNGRVRNGNGWDHPGMLTWKTHVYQDGSGRLTCKLCHPCREMA